MGVTALAPDGKRWFVGVTNAGSLDTPTQFPSGALSLTAVDSPIQLSTDQTTAWKWEVSNAGSFTRRSVPVASGTINWMEFLSPNGTSYALELNNSGTPTVTAFPARLRPSYNVLILGQDKLYVPDARFPLPRGLSA